LSHGNRGTAAGFSPLPSGVAHLRFSGTCRHVFASRAADIATSRTASDNQKIQLWFLQCYRVHNAARKISGDPSLVS